MLVAIDTNVLVYEAGLNDDERQDKARIIRDTLSPDQTVIPTQVVGEFYNVLRKRRADPPLAKQACALLRSSAVMPSAGEATFFNAIELAAQSGLQFWDALILCTAAEAGCAILLSEDMQHGFVHRGVTVIDPFAEPMHPLLSDALSRRRR